MFPSVALPELILYGLAGLIGLAVCFFGYRLFRIWLALAGLQAGFYLGLRLGGILFARQVPIILTAVVGAILLAGLFGLIYRIGAFLAGAGVLVLLLALILQLMPLDSNVRLYALLAAALLGGILGVVLVRPFLILVTALNGAYLVADSVANLMIGTPIGQYVELHRTFGSVRLILLLTGILVLSILGCLAQFRMTRRKDLNQAVPPPAPPLPAQPAGPQTEPPTGPQPGSPPANPPEPPASRF